MWNPIDESTASVLAEQVMSPKAFISFNALETIGKRARDGKSPELGKEVITILNGELEKLGELKEAFSQKLPPTADMDIVVIQASQWERANRKAMEIERVIPIIQSIIDPKKHSQIR